MKFTTFWIHKGRIALSISNTLGNFIFLLLAYEIHKNLSSVDINFLLPSIACIHLCVCRWALRITLKGRERLKTSLSWMFTLVFWGKYFFNFTKMFENFFLQLKNPNTLIVINRLRCFIHFSVKILFLSAFMAHLFAHSIR